MLVKAQELAALEETFMGVDASARPAAVRELAGALVGRADGCGREARVYDEVVCWLVRRSDAPVRAAVAERICAAEKGPELTVSELAHDPDPAVAGPVLRRSPLLSEADLIAVARSRGDAHLCAIAERSNVAEPVTDVVVARGSWPVLRAVAGNATARLSPTSLERLAHVASGDGRITVGLLKRKDVPVAMTQALIGRYDAFSRSGRLEQKGEESGLALDAPPRRAASSAPRSVPSGDALRAAEAQAAAMSRHVLLSADDIGWCVDQERWTEVLAVTARLSAQPIETVARAFVRRNAGAMLSLVFLAGARWGVVERVLLGWEACDARELARHEAAYAGLTRQGAERTVRAAGLTAPLVARSG
jgi:predicted nucleic acid-binding protein